MRKIIGIWDKVTKDFAGPLQVFRHDAPAVRMFTDVAANKETLISQHLTDFELVCVCTLDDDGEVQALDDFQGLTPIGCWETIITGTQLKQAQDAQIALSLGDNNRE